MIEFEIDGKTLQAEQGATIIEAADKAGVYIPRFCYHQKLSVAANCRMCLVEVEKSKKPLPACATPITAGMKVFTKSKMAIESQRAVMEFLLINHPLDCPVCDQGGECELQDLSMGYGNDHSRFEMGKRSIEDKDIGPLVKTYMTRCIYCTRCVRFSSEIAGTSELGGTGRGEATEIGPYVERAMESELSGNIIDLCPVGALTSKPFQFRARAWELRQHASIAPHDCVGSHLFVHTLDKFYNPESTVKRVVPRHNELINECWLSDRDRFSYEGLYADRLAKPRVKQNGRWQEVDWETALRTAAAAMKHIEPEKMGALISPNATLEEHYLLQKLMRHFGSDNIDHRVREMDFADQVALPAFPRMNVSISELQNQQAILMIGSYIRHEQPILGHKIRQASLNDCKVMAINPVDYPFHFSLAEKIIPGVIGMINALAGVVKAASEKTGKSLPESAKAFFADIKTDEQSKTIANYLIAAEHAVILSGAAAQHHPAASVLRSLTKLLAELTGAREGYLTDGANGAGAWLAGSVPHRRSAAQAVNQPGLTAKAMWENPLDGYLLFGFEPEFDGAYSAKAIAALKQARSVIVLSAFHSPAMDEYAHVILPIVPFTETVGTFVNCEGKWQGFRAVTLPYAQARPGWKVLRVLGNLLEVSGFDYDAADEVRDELHRLTESMHEPAFSQDVWFKSHGHEKELMRIGEWPMYRVDGLVRRSGPLQDTMKPEVASIKVHPELAKRLNLKEGNFVLAKQAGTQVKLPLVLDKTIPDGHVYIPMGLTETAGFGEAFGAVEIRVYA